MLTRYVRRAERPAGRSRASRSPDVERCQISADYKDGGAPALPKRRERGARRVNQNRVNRKS